MRDREIVAVVIPRLGRPLEGRASSIRIMLTPSKAEEPGVFEGLSRVGRMIGAARGERTSGGWPMAEIQIVDTPASVLVRRLSNLLGGLVLIQHQPPTTVVRRSGRKRGVGTPVDERIRERQAAAGHFQDQHGYDPKFELFGAPPELDPATRRLVAVCIEMRFGASHIEVGTRT